MHVHGFLICHMCLLTECQEPGQRWDVYPANLAVKQSGGGCSRIADEDCPRDLSQMAHRIPLYLEQGDLASVIQSIVGRAEYR